MQWAWGPDLGQKDKINNGTAATYVELEDCNIEKAFNVQALKEAQAEGRQAQLDTQVLYRRIDWEKLNSVMALSRYCLIFLPLELPSLASHREFIDLQH